MVGSGAVPLLARFARRDARRCGPSVGRAAEATVAGMRELLHATSDRIAAYRESLADARVHPKLDLDALRSGLGGDAPFADGPTPAATVIAELDDAIRPALVATLGPRFFGFVTGGSLDAATCADLLAVGWDQVAFNPVIGPAPAVAEEVAGGWLKDLLGLPAAASVGFVTGGQAANTVGLAAARQHVLAQAGWDVGRDGLIGAPRVRVVASVERHATVDRSLRLLGFGDGLVEEVPADGNGAIDVAALSAALRRGAGPVIVCLQVGNVNTGASDDLVAGCAAARDAGAWVHVDGAFGLWAAANPATAHLVAGLSAADSWACDGHKWLNVPYDSGYVFCAHPEAHVAAMALTASYLVGSGEPGPRNPSDYVPESSRRARGFATWAALRELGRTGVAELVERCCALARRFAAELDGAGGLRVLNDVVLNQVLVRHADDERTDRLVAEVQADGTCWLGGTTWQGQRAMRISVSNHSTTESDVDRTAAVIRQIAARV